MAAARTSRKKTPSEEVDERIFRRTKNLRGKIARDNVDDALKHTNALLERARRRRK